MFPTHWKFVLAGQLDVDGTGNWSEVFECSVNCGFAGSAPSDIQAHLVGISAPVWDWWNTSAAHMSTKARLTHMKLNEIGPDGKYADPSHPHTVDVTPVVGLTAPSYPSFVSVAYSWTTSKLRGPGSRGRIYLPNAFAWTGEVIDATAQGQARDSARGLLDAIVTPVSTHILVPAIASNVDASLTPITGVRIGKVLDVQRRRKNKTPESYLTGVWPA